jgi:outer membrane protein OmpA-like peptidoglycan-associated protein
MADTADTACTHVEGSGCSGVVEPEPDPQCIERDSGSVDTSVEGISGEVTGRECLCASGAPGSLSLVLVLAIALLRRFPALLVLCFATVANAQDNVGIGVDAQHLQTLDGGTFPALREADAGAPWGPNVATSMSYGTGLVNLRAPDGGEALLERVFTTEFGASFRFSEFVRVGAAVPIHPYVRWRGEDVGPTVFEALGGDGLRFGDLALWAQVPVIAPQKGPTISAYVQVDVATGSPFRYLGDPNGGVRAVLALSQRYGDWELLANLTGKFASPVEIPGQLWGVRGEYGLGLHRTITGPFSATVELFGSVSLPPTGGPGDAPLEALLTGGYDLGHGWVIQAGGGGGLTTGVGSPEARAFFMVDRRLRTYGDRDRDGILDRRDRCPDDPEDRDQLGDEDGCPEEDFDGDTIVDDVDQCPRIPETFNGLEDTDGCRDAVTEVIFTVSGPELEQATLSVREAPQVTVFAEEPATFGFAPGRYDARVTARGFHDRTVWFDVPEVGPEAVKISLEPLQFGTVTLHVTDASGKALAGYLRRVTPGAAVGDPILGLPPLPDTVGPLELVDIAGRSLDLPAGPARLHVQAPGYLPRAVELAVPRGANLDVIVELQASDLHMEGNRIVTTQHVRFGLDDATIPPDGEGPLDDLAALLTADTRIELLRVEGHADEQGSSRYNLDLSRRRAQACVDWLVAAGIARTRLEPVGTGEARPVEGQSASRRVEFTVLVWADEAPKPADPAGVE